MSETYILGDEDNSITIDESMKQLPEEDQAMHQLADMYYFFLQEHDNEAKAHIQEQARRLAFEYARRKSMKGKVESLEQQMSELVSEPDFDEQQRDQLKMRIDLVYKDLGLHANYDIAERITDAKRYTMNRIRQRFEVPK